MELPLGGPALRHYTQSRPRPHRQKLNYRPSRPQETIIESENEVLELIGRVDEGVEEFFTKKVLPADTLKKQDDESITVHEVVPASSVPCPPPTKTLRRKLGDFFTLRKRRGLKSETSHEGRPKKASIADLIRPLREVARADKEKDKDRVKEHDKENEKEKEHPSAVAGESVVQETPVSGAPTLRSEAVPPRRALREGKSQSLILLSGSAATGTTNARKKQFEGQHSFEQKLHLMLQRIGVSKAQPGETQNPEREMKKAESEGTIIDSKTEPPATFTKPRTMSASSDTRHQIRPSVSAHESAGKPALLPKPVIKPGPGPTTSGRNTPENELTQIQEGETNTSISPALTAITTPTVATISNSTPDSTDVAISPPSTATPVDSDICSDSVNSTAAATAPTNITEPDSKAPDPEDSTTTTELTTSTFPSTLTSTTTPTESPAPVSVTSPSSESISLSVTSTTTTTTTTTAASITTTETVPAPGKESSVSSTSTDMSAKSTWQEPNSIIEVDAAPSAGGDAVVPTNVDTVSSVSTRISDTPSELSTPSMSVPCEELTPVTSASSATVVPLITKTSSMPPNSTETITTPVSDDPPITSSSTLHSASPRPTSTTLSTSSPTSTDSMSTFSMTHPAIPLPTDTPTPFTSSSETNPVDSTTTTNARLATTAAICSPLTTDSDSPNPNNTSTAVTSVISSLLATDNSSAISQCLTSPAASNSPGQDDDSQTHPEARSCPDPTGKGTSNEEIQVVQKTTQVEKNESKTFVDASKESEICSEEPAVVKSGVMKEEVQEECVKLEEVTTEVVEPASGKEEMTESQDQKETKSVDEK